MNSNLFSIGMFPWLCLTQMPLFFERDWPRKWALFYYKRYSKREHSKAKKNRPVRRKQITGVNISKRSITCFLAIYCALQAVFPYSHFITLGYNTWTDGPYGYSWDMMIHAWHTVRTTVRVRDNPTGQDFYLDAKTFAYTDRWSKHADMAHQFVQCINGHLVQDFSSNLQTPLTSTNVSIYLDVWCSLNGRFQQRIFKPNVDILHAPWSPWTRTTWVLPIISTVSSDRHELQRISQSISSNHSASDVMFIADFPGFDVEHTVSADLNDVTLTIMHGEVQVQSDYSAQLVLGTGMKVAIDTGRRHVVRTLGDKASGTMYVYTNRTLSVADDKAEVLEMWNGVILHCVNVLAKRWKNYKRFVRNVWQSVTSEVSVLCSFGL